MNQGKDFIGCLIHLKQSELSHLLQHGLHHRALPLLTAEVIVHGAKTGIFQGVMAVQMISAGGDIGLRPDAGVDISLVIQGSDFLFCQINVHPADGINHLRKGVKVDLDISVNVNTEVGLDCVDHSRCAFMGIDMRQQVIAPDGRDIDADAALEGDCFDLPRKEVEREEGCAVTAAQVSCPGQRQVGAENEDVDSAPPLRGELLIRFFGRGSRICILRFRCGIILDSCQFQSYKERQQQDKAKNACKSGENAFFLF